MIVNSFKNDIIRLLIILRDVFIFWLEIDLIECGSNLLFVVFVEF